MLTNKELYGTEDVPLVPKEVCNTRLELLKERMAELLSVHYLVQDNSTINEVEKAIKFWTTLRDTQEVKS